MAAPIPPQLRQVTPYVRRAAEVEKTGDPRALYVSYFCRTFAMELGLKAKDKSPEVQGFLLGMLDELEKEKAAHPELGDMEKSEEVVRVYAQEKLTEAENEYLEMNANKNTARRYYAAASFFEVLATFMPDKTLDEATKKSSLFAKWRATEILKAIKEGRPPVPDEEELAKARADASDGDDDEEDEDDEDDNYGSRGGLSSLPPPAPSGTPVPRRGAVEEDDDDDDDDDEDEVPARKPVGRSRVIRQASSQGGSRVSDAQRADAMEYTRFALRAIELDDISIAKQHLESALRELGA